MPPSVPRLSFWGTPEFAVPTLEMLIKSDYDIAHVITQPDKPVGRTQKITAPPVKQCALKHHIPVYQPPSLNDADFISWFTNEKIDLAIVIAYGKIIPASLLFIPRLHMINIHASLLPALRGASPIQSAIREGLDETGVTIQAVSEKMDAGDIFACARTVIGRRETSETLHNKLMSEAAALLQKTLPDLLNQKLRAKKQDASLATYTKILSRDDGKISWDNDALAVDRHIRAMTPWPGAWTHFHKKRLHIDTAIPCDKKSGLRAGTFFIYGNRLFVACGQGTLEILRLKLEGKKSQDARGFINGYHEHLHHAPL